MFTKLFKLIAAALFAFLAWELILVCTVLRLPPQVNHPVLGSMYAGGKYLNAREGLAFTRINTLGMRGDELAQKQEGEYRVLILGDSFTEAAQVSDNRTFCALLEKRLKEVEPGIKVINAGRSGASPAYHIHLADFYGDKVQPDHTVIQISISDFTEDILNPDQYFFAAREGNTFRTAKKPGGVGINPVRNLLTRLELPTAFSTVLIANENIELRQSEESLQPQQAEVSEPNLAPSYLDDELLFWTVKSIKERYGQVTLLYIPYLDSYNLTAGSDELEQKLAKYAGLQNVGFVNMRENFANYYASNKQPIYGFNNTAPGIGHLNEIGHELVAEELFEHLKRMESK